MGQEQSRENPGFSKRARAEKGRRYGPMGRVAFKEPGRSDTFRSDAKAAADALILLDQIVLASRERRYVQEQDEQDLFGAWYRRYLRRQKARRESKRQELAFGLAVMTAVLAVLAYLWAMVAVFRRFPTGWELLSLLFGGLVGSSLLFYKMLGERDARA